ncbi:MAG: hypothetical protein ACK443_09805 [Methylococcaceae bacterium]
MRMKPSSVLRGLEVSIGASGFLKVVAALIEHQHCSSSRVTNTIERESLAGQIWIMGMPLRLGKVCRYPLSARSE